MSPLDSLGVSNTATGVYDVFLFGALGISVFSLGALMWLRKRRVTDAEKLKRKNDHI